MGNLLNSVPAVNAPDLITVSMAANAAATATRDAGAVKIIEGIRSNKWRAPVEVIRAEFRRVLSETGDLKAAKRAVAQHKKNLPGVLWSGTFTSREKPVPEKLLVHSGLLCADLDDLGERLDGVRSKLVTSPHLFALFTSPTGNGLKAVFCVPADGDMHAPSFRAVEAHVRELTGEEIDGACKDIGRLCFVSHDPEAFLNSASVPLEQLPVIAPFAPQGEAPATLETAPAVKVKPDTSALAHRRIMAADVLGTIEWQTPVEGFCECPGWQLHTGENGPRDCRVNIDGTTTVFCFHSSCREPVAAINAVLRSAICEGEAAKRVLDLLDAREFNPAVKPKDSPAVFSLNGVDICTPGNLTAITSGVKTGKTAFLGAMVASVMAGESRDTLSVKSSNPEGRAVLRYDTEQSAFDHWTGDDRALRRAGVTRPLWFHSYYVAGLSVRELVIALTANLKRMDKAHGGIHSILLDGVADFASDINDPAESNALVAQLHGLAIQYHCPIICVIHFNPGGEKTRGHLGSQLERKAETNLTLRKIDDETVIFSTKQRRQPIPETTGPRFRWSDEHGLHVTCSASENPATQRKVEIFRCELEDIFRERPAMGYSDLKFTVKKCLSVGDRTSERRIKDYRHHGLITQSAAKLFVIKGQS